MKKFITIAMIIATLALGLFVTDYAVKGNEVQASGYVTRKATYNWHANGGWVSGWFTLNGTGYSYPNSGSVSSKWINSGSAVGHWIAEKRMWTAKTPRGTHLYGQATNHYGVNTAWVDLNITSDTQTIGVQF